MFGLEIDHAQKVRRIIEPSKVILVRDIEDKICILQKDF